MAGHGPKPDSKHQSPRLPGSGMVPPGLRVRGAPLSPDVQSHASGQARPQWTGFAQPDDRPKPVTGKRLIGLLVLAGVILAASGLLVMRPWDRKPERPAPAITETTGLLESGTPGEVMVILADHPPDSSRLQADSWRPPEPVQLPVTPANAAAWRAALMCAPPNGLIVLPGGTGPDPLDTLVADPAFADWFDTHYARNASQHVRLFRTRLVETPDGRCGPAGLRPRQIGGDQTAPGPGR